MSSINEDTIKSILKEMNEMKNEINSLKEKVSSLEHKIELKEALDFIKQKIGLEQGTNVELYGVTVEDLLEGELTCVSNFHDGTPSKNTYNNTALTTKKGKKKEIRCVSSTNLDREGKIQMLWKDNNTVVLCPSLVHYYEVSIKGKSEYCWISVGLSSTKTMIRNHQIGWDKRTIGIHSDDGKVFNENGKVGLNCTTSFGPGDVIGCGWNSTNKTVFFTRNGEMLDTFNYPHTVLNFGIGMKDFEKIEINTGEREPFEFDLCSFVEDLVAHHCQKQNYDDSIEEDENSSNVTFSSEEQNEQKVKEIKKPLKTNHKRDHCDCCECKHHH
ncbi:SPRY domain containing protein [Entamoeba histolytica HM-1:IMSS-B]|uniref:Uncharacterized protein n=7 Tax=Entamoeba histolytica TaxID=5759 RepID=C4LVT1_ENTH1|nr:uncharacterized protein EHI_187140 [Entamoeba histolytica HM-1:IMSS]EMD47812.1 SPRY domain containing protein [Entamoeba histolytica KU27]EMH77124.1 SPRY domain containing protein [Entamoeba histolytica HM-1:IMSS-B]EMS10777.1 SPRY domain containing protein [Entamoeba histolytica HM-3:IMSS]ENY63743.1 SPRY domain containing protein [Entamoeba histolytica HM-1:IMSS-A]BAN38763.1 hypothetical protein, conserved domain containing [Entamoeba histolytica]|eukprot:XP_656472.1 uncharacterized protein EHI_187140 [Entamoeba histolytica HM-1:IMSS]